MTPAHDDVDCRIVAYRVRSADVIDPTIDFTAAALKDEVKFLLPRTLSSRIASQSGIFSIHPRPNEPWLKPLANPDNCFVIPGAARAFFVRRLFYLGVDRLYLMGGLDGLGARLAWQFDRNVGLGSVK